MIAALLILAWAGLCLGSFLNVWVWRTQRHMGFFRGRSQCDACGHTLSPLELIPVISWILLHGRCRYCKAPISWGHPLVEVSTAFLFAGSYFFWPQVLAGSGQWLLFVGWLLTLTGLIALFIYDAHWMLLPNKILHPTLFMAAAVRAAYIIGFEPDKRRAFFMWALALLVSSGMFWLLFIISSGRWIGFGDVRLGLILGSVLADPAKCVLMIFLASIGGLLSVLPAIVRKQRSLGSKLPYGPFLIGATIISLLFGSPIIDWYKNLFLP